MSKTVNLCIACKSQTAYFCRLPAYADITGTLKTNEYVDYVFCRKCKTIQQSPLPHANKLLESVKKTYANTKDKQEFEIEVSENAKSQHRKIVSTLIKLGIATHVLEIGCGIGALCQMMINQNINCTGIDVAYEIVRLAQDRGLPVNQQDFKKIKKKNLYNAIVMSHVFEHLSDPDETLHKIHGLLKPKGYFLTAQPTAFMTHFLNSIFSLNRSRSRSLLKLGYLNLNPWHIIIYSILGMKILADRHGFETIEIVPMPSVKGDGIFKIIRPVYNFFNRIGEIAFPSKWPFHVAHLFIMRKK
ncbi:hypothetical protein A3J15_00235 [Candidatus Roizmanbacteria bacterium RIFCSPLOWO2_02_FULL_38_10]|uniref:Methyltransferase type 11 n=1 Tax=Candidatus Roizmanbacteria bacterium RIFCSPLOWO2_02_FULL_38_10 TaxID=1802074 RepID=A0A1F7JNJ7_9BACT|nr:MAG: hypothetical protein A3J15_00235 [Candidatus Roizmanbacteria bacterium RIFCSPLOWO2_02_FULL_38_10]